MDRLSSVSVAAATEHTVRAMTRRSFGDNQVINFTAYPSTTDRSVVELSRCLKLRVLRLVRCNAVARRSVKVLAMQWLNLALPDLAGVGGIRDCTVRDIYSASTILHTLILEDTSVSDESITKLVKNCRFFLYLNVNEWERPLGVCHRESRLEYYGSREKSDSYFRQENRRHRGAL